MGLKHCGETPGYSEWILDWKSKKLQHLIHHFIGLDFWKFKKIQKNPWMNKTMLPSKKCLQISKTKFLFNQLKMSNNLNEPQNPSENKTHRTLSSLRSKMD